MIMPQYRNKILASGKQVRIVKRFFFEKLGINPNTNSRHLLAALFQLLLFMFANNVSAEEASNQLKIELSDSLVASADTLLRRLKQTNERLVQKAFDNTVKRIVKSLAKKRYIMAIDYHDIPYYGDKNNLHVRGTKRQRGTNYCHQYATLEIVEGKQRLTIAVKKLSLDNDLKALVVEELVRIAKKHAEIRIVLLDRAFYGAECIKTLKLQRVKFVIAVPKDDAIKRAIAENSLKLPIVVQHCVGEKETFNLCMIYSEKKEPDKPTPVYCFATNIQTTDAKKIAELYRKRWSIETGYRSKKHFRARTSTPNSTVRAIYFFMECLLYNAWYETKTVTYLTIETFKKTVNHFAIKPNLLPDGVT